MAVSNSNGCGTWIVVAFVGAVAWQCTRDKTPAEVETDSASYNSRDALEQSYSTYDVPAPAYPVEEYRSPEPYVSSGYQNAGAPYGCTSDCSGHDAGWEWAEENEITDPYDCGGNSISFEEGCMAYAEEIQAEQAERDRW